MITFVTRLITDQFSRNAWVPLRLPTTFPLTLSIYVLVTRMAVLPLLKTNKNIVWWEVWGHGLRWPSLKSGTGCSEGLQASKTIFAPS